MRDHYDLGTTTPSDEDCVPVKTGTNYMPAMRKEAQRMINLCRLIWPETLFRIHSNDHDFSSYLTIEIVYDDNDEEAWDQINEVESNWPSTWGEAEAMMDSKHSADLT
jgi:hypothetical protein